MYGWMSSIVRTKSKRNRRKGMLHICYVTGTVLKVKHKMKGDIKMSE
jgi:hypothetical protein